MVGVKALKYLNPWTSNSPRMRLTRGMAYGCISGILSAHSLLVAKSAVELIVRTIVDRKNQFNRWQSWMILLGLLFLALTQLYYLHRGLKLCSTSILYPFIALGTVILLAGVLALSWRLNNDQTSKTPGVQTPLTPGMGFLPPDSDTETESSSPPTDEESQLLPNASPTPNYQNGRGTKHATFETGLKRNVRISSAPLPRRSKTIAGALPTITRTRQNGIAEVDEIWGELEEGGPSPLMSPFSQRRSSAWSTPLGFRPSGGMTESTELPPPDETTDLLSRSGTGRSYRDRKRRKSAPLGGDGTQEPAQDALGGWWKMRWWRDKGKGKDPDADAGGVGE
ncbi:hypothetical protein MMC30_007578 [Trapelia coarctata]|nr:hypothetical protein [Trapelia coarctata]